MTNTITLDVKSFVIADPNINFSDHLPLVFEIVIMYSNNVSNSNKSGVSGNGTQYQLRWDKGNIESYYH